MEILVSDLAEKIGADGAMRVITAFGGRSLRVPRRVRDGDALALVLGDESAAALVRAFGRRMLALPTARGWRAREIAALRARGVSVARIAAIVGVRPRQVYRVLKAKRT